LNFRRTDREMRKYYKTPFLLLAAFTVSCATRTVHPTSLGTPCSASQVRLTQAWRALHEALQAPGGCELDSAVRCEALRSQIERLSVDCPGNPDIVMANALLAFDGKDFVRSQQLLDQIFSTGVVPPEAAVLRARIAIEQGNLQFAIRFLDQQIHQTGDSAGLRETYASALFLAGRLDEADIQLSIAEKLAAPGWRVAYGKGLIDEARGRFAEAGSRYQEALRAKPGWKQAESRLRALVASGKIQSTENLK